MVEKVGARFAVGPVSSDSLLTFSHATTATDSPMTPAKPTTLARGALMTQPPLDDAVRQQTRIERSQARPIIPAGLLRSGPSRRHTTPSGSRDDEGHHASGLDRGPRKGCSN